MLVMHTPSPLRKRSGSHGYLNFTHLLSEQSSDSVAISYAFDTSRIKLALSVADLAAKSYSSGGAGLLA